jgi:hypothetical protein
MRRTDRFGIADDYLKIGGYLGEQHDGVTGVSQGETS